jgi:hypothetical protein
MLTKESRIHIRRRAGYISEGEQDAYQKESRIHIRRRQISEGCCESNQRRML